MGYDSREDIQATFGRNLRWYRQQRGMTQEELAARGGLHWTYVGQIERGERNLTLYNIVRLSRGLQLPASDLFAGIDGFEPEL